MLVILSSWRKWRKKDLIAMNMPGGGGGGGRDEALYVWGGSRSKLANQG